MDKQILGWAEMAADAAQVAAGLAVLFVLLRLRRDIAALLRVVRGWIGKRHAPRSPRIEVKPSAIKYQCGSRAVDGQSWSVWLPIDPGWPKALTGLSHQTRPVSRVQSRFRL